MEPFDVRPASPSVPAAPVEPTPAPPADGVYRWRIRPLGTVLKGIGAVLFLAAGVWAAADRVALAVGVAGFVVLAALAVRDLVAGVPLAADATGVRVRTGFAGHRHIPWDEVERVRVDRRSRLGVRTEAVEIDCDTELYLFSANQLGGTPCADVVRRLAALRSGVAEDLRGSADGEQDEDQQ